MVFPMEGTWNTLIRSRLVEPLRAGECWTNHAEFSSRTAFGRLPRRTVAWLALERQYGPRDMSKEAVRTSQAPAAIGPYSQGLRVADWLFVSGQLPVDPATQQLIDDDAGRAASQALANLAAVLRASGATLSNVIKTTIYLKDLSDFAAVNEAYAKWFDPPYPVRSTVQVSALPKGALVEIDAIAHFGCLTAPSQPNNSGP